MQPNSRRHRWAFAGFALLLLVAAPLWAALTPGDIGDIAPRGAPDGQVDAADVALVLRAIAGDVTLDDAAIERADAAPVQPLSPATPVPQTVRPNPNPTGPLDIGDAVVIARRAAGLIVFDRLNVAPVVTVQGHGTVISNPQFLLIGRLVDDTAVAAAKVELRLGAVVVESAQSITPDADPVTSGGFTRTLTLVDGANDITVTPRDADGRLGAPVTVRVTLDRTPPVLTIAAPAEGFLTGATTVEFSGTASDASGVTVSVGATAATVLPPNLWGATVTLPLEDENLFGVVARDGATPANVTTLSRVVIRDTTAPTVTIDALPDAVSTQTIAMSGNVADAWGVASVTVGTTEASITWNPTTRTGRWVALMPVLSGPNEYAVVAVDNVGNRTTAGPARFTGDFDPPVVALTSPAWVSATPASISISISEPVFLEQFGATVFSPPLSVPGGAHTQAGVVLGEGANDLTVRVRDLAGNVTTEVITIGLDTRPPLITITKVSNTGFTWVPAGGLDNVVTNAPSALVEGTVSDAIGLASVKVNGFDATVNAATGTFSVAGVPLVPRANTIAAVARDLAGNSATSSVTIRRDVEGPVVTLSFSRAAYVSALNPPPAPFDAATLPARYYRSAADITVTGSASDPNYTGRAETMVVRLDGAARAVTGSAPFTTFSFTLPVAVLRTRGLHVIEVESTDSLGNTTLDVQSMLDGQWVTPNATIPNAIGLAAGPDALAAVSSLIAAQVGAMNGDIADVTTTITSGVTMTIFGIAFCQPPGNPAQPPYNCTPAVNVALTLTPDGHVAIRIVVPTLYAGIGTTVTGFLPRLLCGNGSQGYLAGSPTTITLQADFVNGASGVTLQPIAGTTVVAIGTLNIQSNNGCVDTAASLLNGLIKTVVQDQFAGQIPTLLSAVNGVLSKPLLSNANTGQSLWIARGSNDANALRFWMDAKGNPCPTASSKTSLADKTTSDPNDFKPCPADSPRLAPGSYAGTRNPDATTLPALDLVSPAGTAVSAEVAANDEFTNYMVHEQWAMGAFDLAIDQSFLGDDAAITLDTDSLSLFIADFKRADVVAKIPLGSKVAIQTAMPLPPVLAGRQTGPNPFYDLAVGDMTWRFFADADNNLANGYETPLFTASVTLRAPAQLRVVPAPTDNADDILEVKLGTPSLATDITDNPLVLNETAVRTAIATLIDVALPSLTGGLTNVALPSNTARFQAARNEAPAQDFLVLSGALLQTITVTSPAAGSTTTADPVVVTGTVDGLTNSATASVALWLDDDLGGRAATITARPTANSLAFRVTVPRSALKTGDNTARVVATDANGKKASVTQTLTLTASGVTAGASGGCGSCDGTGSGSTPAGLLLLVAFAFLIRANRRVSRPSPRRGPVLYSSLLPILAVSLVGGAQCGSCDGCGEKPRQFNGAALSKDPAFLISELQIGNEEQGFNVDETSPDGDALPDNALQALGSLANEALAGAVEEGSLLLLVQFPGLQNLPAPGEGDFVDAVAFVGVDFDDDPRDNHSGSETFGKDPASFDEADKPLIVFRDVYLSGNPDGSVSMEAGPSTFELAVPLQGSSLTLKLSPTYITATLGISPLRADGFEARDGLLGGVLPAAPLATPLPGLPFAPIVLLAEEIDVDLNGDGELDRSTTADNKDGLSAGLVFSAVPAYLSEEHVNRKPRITLDAVPDLVNSSLLTVTGTLKDPDADCLKSHVLVTVNGLDPVQASVVAVSGGCSFTAGIRLILGRNAIDATATDEPGGKATAQVVTRFEDDTPPTVTLTGPLGRLTALEQVVTGVANDDAGVAEVQLDIAGIALVVTPEQLGPGGEFSVPVTLPAFGENVITAVARDFGDNVSAPATLTVTPVDIAGPAITFTAASTELARVETAGPWTLPAAELQVEGKIEDNAGFASVVATWTTGAGDAATITIDAETGTFVIPMTRDRGTYTLRVEALDASGNRTLAEQALTVADQVGPVIVVESPEALTHSATHELVLRLTDDWEPAAALVAVAGLGEEPLTAVPFDVATGTFRRPVTLVVGANLLVIEARDPAGNVTRVEGSIELVDEEPPILTVSAPVDGSWTVNERVVVVGTARDNIGPVRVNVDVDGVITSSLPAPDGTFAVDVALAMGVNTITVAAVDAAGLTTQLVRRLERKDPNLVATVELAATPTVVAIGNDTVVSLTATLTRLAGGPVPDGTVVAFESLPATLGVLESLTATTLGGQATARYTPGRTPGLATVTATAQAISASTSITIAKATAVALDICLVAGAKLTGVSFDLAAADGATFEPAAPATDATEGLGVAAQFHVYNRAALPTGIFLAGTNELTGADAGTPIARVTWPLTNGIVTKPEVVISDAKRSDEEGVTSDAQGLLSVCGVEHLLGVLPPRVTLAAIASPTASAVQVVSGTVESAALAGATAVLSLNGVETTLDVSTGTFSRPVTLAAGLNEIRVVVTDSGGQQGSAERQVRYSPLNAAPLLTITAPGSAVTSTTVTAQGAVSDADDGLTGLVVSVKVGAGSPVAATIDAAAGIWRATVTLLAGTNTLAVTATDARGASSVVTQSTQVVAAVTPPRITLTAPTDGRISTTPTIGLVGRVDDGGNPATLRVTLTVNGVAQPITFSPFTRELSGTITLQGGTNIVVVTATDLTNQVAVATVRVDYASPDSAPKVTITAPLTASRWATRTLAVRGTVRDDKSLAALQSMTVNGVPATLDTATGNWTANVTLAPGSRTITAEAVDERSQSGTASVTVQIFDPIVVVNYLQIGGPADGFNVDSTPLHPLSDAAPDNALSGLASIANTPLQEQINGTSGKPLLILFEFIGLTQLPAPGQSVTVAINGYLGLDGDANAADNFSGAESFAIDPASFDVATGLPLIRFTGVVITNTFGVLKFDTFPASPARFQLSVDSTTPPLELKVDPAYVRATISLQNDGLRLSPGVLGGVVPASTLTIPIAVGELSIVPLQLLLSSDPANPVPDCDLNGDGVVNTTDATASNPDGVSVGIVFSAVPAGITR